MLLNILFSILGLILYFFLRVGKLYELVELVTYIIWLNLYLHLMVRLFFDLLMTMNYS